MTDAAIDLAALSAFPLPPLATVGDKEGRGRVLAVAGGGRVPGAALLTGLAALRAGAGKLQLAATPESALALGLAAPEAAVVRTPATAEGELAADIGPELCEAAGRARAIVVGPGMMNPDLAGAVAHGLMAAAKDAAFVVDAAAMTGLDLSRPEVAGRAGRLVFTPHAGEMATLLETSKSSVEAEPLTAARELAAGAGAVVAMKGARTWIVTPDGKAWLHTDGVVGLATSGSGDVLAGVIAGLLARGATPLAATLWGVCVHGAAGARLSRRVGPLGFLAREILEEVPGVLGEAGGGS